MLVCGGQDWISGLTTRRSCVASSVVSGTAGCASGERSRMAVSTVDQMRNCFDSRAHQVLRDATVNNGSDPLSLKRRVRQSAQLEGDDEMTEQKLISCDRFGSARVVSLQVLPVFESGDRSPSLSHSSPSSLHVRLVTLNKRSLHSLDPIALCVVPSTTISMGQTHRLACASPRYLPIAALTHPVGRRDHRRDRIRVVYPLEFVQYDGSSGPARTHPRKTPVLASTREPRR